MEADVLGTVKLRLGFNDDKDDLISSYIDEIGERIKHYCNLSSIPKGLRHTWASMVMDALRVEQAGLDEIADADSAGVAVQVGDTQVRPAADQGVTAISKSVIDAVVLDYRKDLHHYRRLRW